MSIKNLVSLLVLFSTVSCKNFKQKIEYSTVANLKLDTTMLAVSVVADSLNVPWDIQFLDDHQIIYTEIAGNISKLNLLTGKKTLLYSVPGVYFKRTAGLLGMCLSPDMKAKPYIFISYTTKTKDGIFSKLVRLTLKNDRLTYPKTLHTIAGGNGHNGSRLVFSKDGKLLWATGDVQSKTFAQDSTALNGKILRMNVDGSVPIDNPIPGSLVYAWGFRNIQGLTVSDEGTIYTSEHGDAIEDEINLINPLQNYGWPQIEGMHDKPDELAIAQKYQRTEPVKSWTPVIAPSGLKYYNSSTIPEWNNTLLLVTLKNQSLRSLKLNDSGNAITHEQVFFEKHFGRIRAVTISPSGDVYLATSNRDWNPQPGFPKVDDDKIIKLSPVKKAMFPPLNGNNPAKVVAEVANGSTLYNAYCESCHKENGEGIANVFPPLAGAEQVSGPSNKLIDIVLNGLSGEIIVKGEKYDQQMPGFSFLKDEEIAEILTYIRGNFGNKSSQIGAGEVNRQRK